MNNLGFYLLISLLLNVICFAPLMTFLLTRPSRNAPPSVHTVQVRLLRPDQPENVKVPTPPPPPKPPRQPPPVATAPPPPRQPQPVQPRPEQPRPEAPEVPQARPRTAARKPSAPLPPSPTRPKDNNNPFTLPSRPTSPPASFNPNAVPTPSPGEPGPAEPTPAPAPPAEPQPPASEPTSPSTPVSTPVPPVPQPPPTPPPSPDPGPLSSRGNNTQGTIPDKPASPRGNFPKSNMRAVLRKLGAKTFVRLGLRIHPDGHIDVEILTGSGSPELDQAVLKDLRDWRWDPAEVAGKPVVSERPIRIKLEAD